MMIEVVELSVSHMLEAGSQCIAEGCYAFTCVSSQDAKTILDMLQNNVQPADVMHNPEQDSSQSCMPIDYTNINPSGDSMHNTVEQITTYSTLWCVTQQ